MLKVKWILIALVLITLTSICNPSPVVGFVVGYIIGTICMLGYLHEVE